MSGCAGVRSARRAAPTAGGGRDHEAHEERDRYRPGCHAPAVLHPALRRATVVVNISARIRMPTSRNASIGQKATVPSAMPQHEIDGEILHREIQDALHDDGDRRCVLWMRLDAGQAPHRKEPRRLAHLRREPQSLTTLGSMPAWRVTARSHSAWCISARSRNHWRRPARCPPDASPQGATAISDVRLDAACRAHLRKEPRR